MKLRKPAIILFSSIGLAGFLYACSGTQVTDLVEQGPPTVEIDKEVHFLTPEGEDVVVAPGAYEVQAEKEGLRLVAEEDTSESQIIEAKPITHEATTKGSTALSYSEQEDEQIVMLLLPNGKGLEAQGSYSGVHKRALRPNALRQRQIAQQFDIRKKLQLKPTQLALSAVSVKYSNLKTPYNGRKSRTSWSLPVSDTVANASFTFVWSGSPTPPSQVPEIQQMVKNKTCCLNVLIDNQTHSWAQRSPNLGRLPSRKTSFTAKFDKRGNLVTTVYLSDARSNTWPKTIKLSIVQGKSKWESAQTKIYATTVSYYTNVLHPIFSHDRCVTCHTLGDRPAIVAMHESRLGAGNYPDVEDAKPHNPDFCGGCHSIPQGSGHTDLDLNNEWFSPDKVQGINWKGWNAGRVCAKVTGPFTNKDGVTGAPFDAQTFHHHFHDDPRILWAVSSGWVPFGRPDLPVPMKNNLQGWFNKVDPWVDAGTPCPKWRFFKRPGKLTPRR